MATHSSTLAWKIPWTAELGGLQSTGSQMLDTAYRLNHHHHQCSSYSLIFPFTNTKAQIKISAYDIYPNILLYTKFQRW